jgi:hypothetical protein
MGMSADVGVKFQKMGYEMRPMDKFFSEENITEPTTGVINIVPVDI